MPLLPGTRLGPYEVTAPLGAGGMGEVYRATDTNLKRQVAIKVLPETVAADPERLARFQREAEVLASLNHPNIAGIYGLERTGGTSALVMELVEGPTLADRIALGAIPIDETLPIAKQIVEALEAAHEQGIIHRDLKPANIKVRPDGTVKVLDFGLAKALETQGVASVVSAGLTQSPTITTPAMTQMGMILGTAAYMSPEQARGKPVDKRADIWAFGCVLYEMLTGRPAFEDEDVSLTLSRVLQREPDFSLLPVGLPRPIEQSLRLCVKKHARERIPDIGAVRMALAGAFDTPPSVQVVSAGRRHTTWVAAALGVLSAALVGLLLLGGGQPAATPPRVSFELQVPTTGTSGPFMLALSPDGKNLVARVSGDDGVFRLWVRQIDRIAGVVVPGTEGAAHPFWSPDGQSIGFIANGKLKKVSLLGAPPESLADASALGSGAWNRDGTILFNTPAGNALSRVAVTGGEPRPVTTLATNEASHRYPRFLPDGIHFLYLVMSSDPDVSGIHLGSLDSSETRRLVASTTQGEFAPPDTLLFLRESALMAVRFDPNRLEITGQATRVAEQVGSSPPNGIAGFTTAAGALAYREGSGGRRELLWVDRATKKTETIGQPAGYENPTLSPDGKQLAVFRPEGGGDVWILDLDRGGSTRLTFDGAMDQDPVWSPDGAQIAFISNRDGGVFNLYRKSVGGGVSDELLLKTPYDKWVNDWSPDGRYLLYHENHPQTRSDLWVLPMFGERKPIPVLSTPFNEASGSFSPDGRWLAYESDDGGTRQVYVQAFPEAGRRWQVSTRQANSAYPTWRSDGRELYYDVTGTLMAVDLTGTVPGGEFKAGPPLELFRGLLNLPPHNHDVVEDGRRFLALVQQDLGLESAPVVVVVNWQAGQQR